MCLCVWVIDWWPVQGELTTCSASPRHKDRVSTDPCKLHIWVSGHQTTTLLLGFPHSLVGRSLRTTTGPRLSRCGKNRQHGVCPSRYRFNTECIATSVVAYQSDIMCWKGSSYNDGWATGLFTKVNTFNRSHNAACAISQTTQELYTKRGQMQLWSTPWTAELDSWMSTYPHGLRHLLFSGDCDVWTILWCLRLTTKKWPPV